MKTLLLTLVVFSTALSFGQVGSLDYVENLGQLPEHVNFKANLYNGNVFVEDHCFTYVFHSQEDLGHHHDHAIGEENHKDPEFVRSHAFKTHFLGSNDNPTTSEMIQREGLYNYFIGNDATKWASNVRRFAVISQENVYDGIDLKVYSKDVHMKYDFIVHPKADVTQIRLQHEGVDGVRLKDGKLFVQTSLAEIVENTPYAYQVLRNGSIQEVPCQYALSDEGVVTFVFPEGYDSKRELIIDPVLIAATLSGSTATNYGHSAAFDVDGNIYTGARSFGTGYPTSTGAFQTAFGGGGVDIAVSKLNPDGSTLIYATYLGGSSSDYPHSMITNTNGELWVMGSSNSVDFPVTAGAYQATFGGGSQDHVLIHLSTDGSTLVGGTYLGGNASDGGNNITFNYGDNYRGEIIIDDQDNCYIASCTESQDFPVSAGAYQGTFGGGNLDAVLFSLNSDMSALNWSTYLGAANDDAGFGLRLDGNGDVFACGVTDGTFVPVTGHFTASQGGEDAFVIKLSNDATSLLGGTYWGTSANDNAFFLDLGSSGEVFIYGQGGTNMPVTAGLYVDANSPQYIASFTNDLTALSYSTTVGAINFIPIAFMVDQCERIYFSGHSASAGAPITPDAIETTGGFYIGVLDPGATGLYFGTYYGGSHVDGGTSRFDPSGIVYQGVCTAGGFNTTPGAWSNTQNGWDIGVFKIDFEVPTSSLNIDVDDVIACGEAPYDVPFQSTAGSNATFTWDFGDNNSSTDPNPTHQYLTPGIYDVVLIAEDSTGCVASDTAYSTVEIILPEVFSASWDFTPPPPCSNAVSLDLAFTGSGADSLVWVLPDTTLINVQNYQAVYTAPGQYNVSLIAYDFDCSEIDTITETFSVSEFTSSGTILMPNVFTPDNDGKNEVYKPRYEANPLDDVFEGLAYYHIVIIDRWGSLVFESGELPSEWVWDGSINGGDIGVDGTYFYQVEYREYCTSDNDSLEEKHGFIHLENK